MTPFTGSSNLLEWLRELQETLMFTSLLTRKIKDTVELPDDDIHRIRSGRVLSTGALSLWSWGASAPLPATMCSPTWKLSKP